MGWTSTNYDKERDGGVAGFFTREMLPYEVLDSALVARTTWYAAVRLNGVVSGVVVKIQWSAKRADFNITFKDMSECEGPYAFECPERILKLLTPLPPLPPEGESDPNEYARNWRFRNWERILALKAAPKVQVGDLLEFETPFKFEGMVGESNSSPPRPGPTAESGTGANCPSRSWQRFNLVLGRRIKGEIMKIKSVQGLDDVMEGNLGGYAFPGGYPIFFVTSDGGVLSYAAVQDNRGEIDEAIRDRDNSGWRVVGADVNYEDAFLFCDHTGERIESAYAEDEEEDTGDAA